MCCLDTFQSCPIVRAGAGCRTGRGLRSPTDPIPVNVGLCVERRAVVSPRPRRPAAMRDAVRHALCFIHEAAAYCAALKYWTKRCGAVRWSTQTFCRRASRNGQDLIVDATVMTHSTEHPVNERLSEGKGNFFFTLIALVILVSQQWGLVRAGNLIALALALEASLQGLMTSRAKINNNIINSTQETS